VIPAQVPPVGLPGLRPEWSRLVTAPDHSGANRTWHLLDTGEVTNQRLTILCVHGNPTWSYLWREVLEQAPSDVRVIAVDQLDMGYSERTGVRRRLADRIADLDALTQALALMGPVVVVAHDWGGPIALGWVQRNVSRVVAVALLNTAVHQPHTSSAPAIIRAVRARAVLNMLTWRTKVFVRGTTGISRFGSGKSMTVEVARAFAEPYQSSARRAAIRDFVADIPLEAEHPSMAALNEVAANVSNLRIPVAMLWGPGDPVFGDAYLDDLRRRIPHADVHRYEGARHLVLEDAPAAVKDLLMWIDEATRVAQTDTNQLEMSDVRPITHELQRRAGESSAAIVEISSGQEVSWAQLHERVNALVAHLHSRGVVAGDRVAILVPPSVELVATVYACWATGAVVVVADAGLGVRGMRRALRGACPDHVVGIPAGLALSRTLRIPGQRIKSGQEMSADANQIFPTPPELNSDALVVFTSGATGPSKGVVYSYRRLCALRQALTDHYEITEQDALVGAFAPWIVLGPALGIASVIPDMDLRAAESLTARAVATATARVNGTLMWASPAALQGVATTADQLTISEREQLSSLRLILGAGAPVPIDVLRTVSELVPTVSARTPYGMTEVLPVSDVSLQEIDAAGIGNGVLVGRPVNGVEVAIAPLDTSGVAGDELTISPDTTGEIVVRAAHAKERYDNLWVTQHASAQPAGWPRTGDVGHLDQSGRLWVEGRLAHVIVTANGPVTPVGPEQRVLKVPHVAGVACVGVGPRGIQQAVIVVVAPARAGVAPVSLTDRVREAAGVEVAAVLVIDELPVDIRHHSKVDRTAVARWAEATLAGVSR
jgi:acyl-coenzyme A synthetase/AMP-(fatty) acid ligase